MQTNTGEAEARPSEPVIESLPDEKSRETAEIMRRFNDVFLRHDPSELKNLVAENCVIEKVNPGPDGQTCGYLHVIRHARRHASLRYPCECREPADWACGDSRRHAQYAVFVRAFGQRGRGALHMVLERGRIEQRFLHRFEHRDHQTGQGS